MRRRSSAPPPRRWGRTGTARAVSCSSGSRRRTPGPACLGRPRSTACPTAPPASCSTSSDRSRPCRAPGAALRSGRDACALRRAWIPGSQTTPVRAASAARLKRRGRAGIERRGVVGELFGMWRNTRMVVLTAICAALYAAILIPFKVAPIIPGVTELRPANALPIVCSFLFGPAGAWGAAFGNLIGDFFGGLGPGDLFGFAGNLLFALTPYGVWDALTGAPPVPTRRASWWILFVGVVVVSSTLCATVIGWGRGVRRFHPFARAGVS